MRDKYFKTHEPLPSAFAVAILLLMLLALFAAPHLAFASSDQPLQNDPLPRYVLTPDDISAKIAEELVLQGHGELIEASIQLEDPNTIYGADEPISIQVASLQASKKSRQWTANIMFKNGSKILTAVPMQGRFDEMVSLPVLSRPMASGEIIEKNDIITKTFPIRYQRAGVIISTDELIGKSARRNISDDRPIREHEISAPLLVKKNDLISLSYAHGNLVITTTGQALADAAQNDVIEVKNINSDKNVRAQIKDAKTATVVPLLHTATSMNDTTLGESYDYN